MTCYGHNKEIDIEIARKVEDSNFNPNIKDYKDIISLIALAFEHVSEQELT